MIDVDGLGRVAPRWAQLLREKGMERYGYMAGKELDIGKWNYCIVGEAYGFRSQDELTLSPNQYDGCGICLGFANEFDNLFLQDDPLGLQQNIVRFMKHIDEKHPHLIKEIPTQ